MIPGFSPERKQFDEIMKNRKFTIEVGSAYIAVLALFVLFANMF